MFKTKYVNPVRRDLVKQLTALGALVVAGGSLRSQAQSSEESDQPINRRGESGYDALRSASLWRSNQPNRFPDAIVEANGVDDLRAALAFAQRNDLQVVCRASGHSTAGAPLRNGGLMIYVNRMNGVSVDANARTVTVGPGTTMAGLYGEASRYGLDFPTADCSTVAIAGFILGGGFGRNCMQLTGGPVCKALVSADVMLANGEILTVSETSHPDVYWAMCGCGPAFFGVITQMTLRLFEPPGAYMASSYQYESDALPSLVDFFDRHESQQDARVSNRISIRSNPSQPNESIVVARVSVFADPGSAADEQARRYLAYYADAGLGQRATQKNEYETQRLSGYMMTTDPTAGTHTDNIYTDDASSLLAASHLMESRPEGFSVHLDLAHNMQYHLPNDADKAFFSSGRHFLSTYVDWTDTSPARNALAYEWSDRFANVAKQFATGSYLNQIDTALYPEKIEQGFAADSWERLGQLRDQYDPDNRFFTYVDQAS